MPKAIIAGLPEFAHMTPLLAVARELVTRGHEVFVYTGARFEELALATGARFHVFPRAVDFDEQDHERHLQESAQIPDPAARYAFDIKAGLINPIPELLRGLQALLDQFPADVILSENTFLPPLALALGAPTGQRPVLVTLGIGTPLFHSQDTAPPGSALSPISGGEGRKRHQEMNAVVKRIMATVQTSAERTFASLGVKLDEFLWDAALHHSDHYLQLTIPSFEYPRSDAPAHFRCVGPVSPDSGTDTNQRATWRPDFSDKRPIVAVVQSREPDAVTDLLAPTFWGVADLDVLAVVATGHDGDPGPAPQGTVPGNGRLTSFAPFDQLLPAADVLITHGGYDRAHAALRHGVPIVVAGSSEDEAEVAARVEWSGTGVRLTTGPPRPTDIRTAVQTVLDNPRFRMRALTLSHEFNRYRAFDAIAEIVNASQSR